MTAPNAMEKGYAWILQEAKDLAKVERIPINRLEWVWDAKGGAALPEPSLCFDLRGTGHCLSFSEAEVDDCGEPDLDSKRPIVTRRLQDTYRRLKHEMG